MTADDEGISGAQAQKRPDFLRMMNQCKKGKIDLIITKSVSRFARNTVDAVSYVRMLKSHGVGVIFEKEGFNTLEESSELFLTLMSSMAQEELHSLSQNVKMGKRMHMKEGKVSYQFSTMYGYRKGADGNPEMIPEEAEIVKQIYRRYLVGDSMAKITTALNQANHLDRKGNPWTESKIRAILQHERYCGDVILQKTFISDPISKKVCINNGELPKYHIKNNHVAMIPRETWNAVQGELLRRANKVKKVDDTNTKLGKYNGKYALNEILVCGCCGAHYKRAVWTKRDGEKQPVWRCGNQVDEKSCPNSVNIEEKSSHDGIVQAMFHQQPLSSAPFMEKLRKVCSGVSEDGFDIAQAEDQIQTLIAQTMKLVAECSANNTVHENQDQIKALSDQAKSLKERVDQEKMAIQSAEKQAKFQEKMEQITSQISAYSDEQVKGYDDTLVRQTIHTIKVVASDRIDITMESGTTIIQPIKATIRKLDVG
ncbi:MAG: recombinase family protein [Eubacteriales bacterium]